MRSLHISSEGHRPGLAALLVRRGDLLHGRRQDGELVRRERIGEVRRDGAEVTWRRALEQVPGASREDDVGTAAVGGARRSLHKTVPFKSIDRPGNSAFRQERALREIGRSDARFGTAGDLHKEEVLSKGKASAAV
jgi:hypothetical protein